MLLKCVNILGASGAILDLRKLPNGPRDLREPRWHDNEAVFLLMVLRSVSSSVEMLQRADRVPSTGIGSTPPPPPCAQSLPVLAALFPTVPLLSAAVVFM